jgi:hexosaminidase
MSNGFIMFPAIIPKPKTMEIFPVFCVLPDNLEIDINSDDLEFLAEYSAGHVFKDFSCLVVNGEATPCDTRVSLCLMKADSVDLDEGNKEAYTLNINEIGIAITAVDTKGIFFALQTVIQLLNQYKNRLPQLSIHDEPKYSYRGMHLDVSRHFKSVEFIKRYIDLIALHKMNTFHWHLTDDQGWRIEIKKFPKLTQIGAWREGTVIGHTSNRNPELDGQSHGGFYTQEEIRQVVAYAQQRAITVIPEIDVPGHAAAMLAAYPEYACDGSIEYKVQERFGIFTDALCPHNATFTMLEGILAEVADLFPSEYIHIGGDEVKKTQWQSCPQCQALMAEKEFTQYDQLHGYFVSRVEMIATKLNKKIIGWDELLDADVNNSATIMTWQGMDGGIRAVKAGHSVIMTPVSHTYFDFYQSSAIDEPQAIHGLTTLKTVYDFEPTPEELSPQQQKMILGAQGNVWTEYMADEMTVERMVLPRMSALAEVLWSEDKDWQSFTQRLPVFSRYLMSCDYQVSDAYKNVSARAVFNRDESTLKVELKTEVAGLDILFIDNDKEPKERYQSYIEPISINGRKTIIATSVDKQSQKQFGIERLSVDNHLAINKPIRFAHEPDTSTSPLKGQLLVNGMLATDRVFQYHEWASFDENGMDAVIDLEQPVLLSSVDFGFETELHRRLYIPTFSKVEISNDGINWQLVAQATEDDIKKSSPRLTLEFKQQTARYIRVIAENNNRDYSAEDKKIITMPIFIDEIIVK